MSRFASALKIAIEYTGNTRSQICERCEIEPAALSKYLNGKILPRKNVLEQIANALPAKHRAEIYLAYVRDHLPEEAEDYIYISTTAPVDGDPSNKPTKKQPKLPSEVEDAFAELRDLASKSPTVSHSILTLSRVMLGVDLDKVK